MVCEGGLESLVYVGPLACGASSFAWCVVHPARPSWSVLQDVFRNGEPVCPKGFVSHPAFALEDDAGGVESSTRRGERIAIDEDQAVPRFMEPGPEQLDEEFEFEVDGMSDADDGAGVCDAGDGDLSDNLEQWLTELVEEEEDATTPVAQELVEVEVAIPPSSSEPLAKSRRLSQPKASKDIVVLEPSANVGETFDYFSRSGDRFRMTPKGAPLGSSSEGSWQCTCYVHPAVESKKKDGKTKRVTHCTRTLPVRHFEHLMAWAEAAHDFVSKDDHQQRFPRPTRASRASSSSAAPLDDGAMAAGEIDDDSGSESSSGSSDP